MMLKIYAIQIVNHAVNIQSFVRGDITQKSCLILDEIDGSDPHAQMKID
jgi:hypothetical protein